MNKSELIEAIARETELSKAAAGHALDAALSTIVKVVPKKEDVQLIGFGTFKAGKRAARTGKNPRTGEKLKIAAATVPKFSAGAGFKTAVNKKTDLMHFEVAALGGRFHWCDGKTSMSWSREEPEQLEC